MSSSFGRLRRSPIEESEAAGQLAGVGEMARPVHNDVRFHGSHAPQESGRAFDFAPTHGRELKHSPPGEQARGRDSSDAVRLVVPGQPASPKGAKPKSERNPLPGSPLAPRILYDRSEAAYLLSMSVSSIVELVHRGLLREVRKGRRLLIHRDELERFAKEDTERLWEPGRNGKGIRARSRKASAA